MAEANPLAPKFPTITLTFRPWRPRATVEPCMPSALEFAVATLIMAAGSAFQAAVGLGLALLVVPLLALIDTRFIPGPMLFAGIALAAATAYRDRAAIDRATLGLSLVGLTLGTCVGAIALKLVGRAYLPKLFGALILLAVLISVASRRVAMTPRTLLAGSTASGIMGTMVGVHGPAISLVLQNEDPAQVRAMLGAFFVAGYAIAVAALALLGVFGRHELGLGMALLPGVGIGYLVAPAISKFINTAVLRIAILIVSSVSAVGLLLR
jgi:uncharacterized protein